MLRVRQFRLALPIALTLLAGCAAPPEPTRVATVGHVTGRTTIVAANLGERPIASAPVAPRTTAPAVPVIVANAGLPAPSTFFIPQYHDDVLNPSQQGTGADCGPACLAMALTAFGKVPPELRGVAKRHDLIMDARMKMTGNADESAWTYPGQFEPAARDYGLYARQVFGSEAILAAMSTPGRLAILNVNPSPAYANALTFPFDGGHFSLMTGYDGTHVGLDDPLARGPLVISPGQLDTALTTPLGTDPGTGREVEAYDGAIVLSTTPL